MNILNFLKRIEEHMQDGYLRVDKKIPLYAHGNILEWTGQLLIVLKFLEKDFPEEARKITGLILMGLQENQPIDGLIPRTKCLIGGEDENPEENKKRRWEYYDKIWWRSGDVSDSQFCFLTMGLSENMTYEMSFIILWQMLLRLFNGNLIIRGIDNKPCRLGRFRSWIPLNNSYLRLSIINQIAKKIFMRNEGIFSSKSINILDRGLIALNKFVLSRIPLDPKSEDSKNTALLLHFLGIRTGSIFNFFLEYKSNIEVDITENLETGINYLLCTKIILDY